MTTTWYTAPLQFNSFQVPDAFIVPFTEPMPGQFEHNGQNYSGVQFYYLVFPYRSGNFKVPSIEIIATSPPEGSSVGRKVTIHTAPQAYVVKPVSREFPAGEEWMVAKNVVLNESWSKPADSLKVGDVITRTVTINAMGTVPQLIPGTKPVKEPWAGIYPATTRLTDTRDENDANGERVEHSTYLLLKPGDYELPVVTVYWWNPYAGRLYRHSTPARKIHVRDNPDLGMLTTLTDSLAAASQTPVQAKKGPLTLMGLRWYWALLCGIVIAGVLWLAARVIIRMVRRGKKAYARYKAGELYWFRKFVRARPGAFLRQLYQWWDRFVFPGKQPAVASSIPAEKELKETLGVYMEQLYHGAHADPAIARMLQQQLRHFRKKILHARVKERNMPENQELWP